MSNYWFGALAWVFAIALAGGVAQESSCGCGSTVVADMVAGADVVFVGVPDGVTAIAASPSGDHEIWDFEIESVVKGPFADRINVSAGGGTSNCSTTFTVGERIGVLANWQAGHLVAGQCGVVTAAALAPFEHVESGSSGLSAGALTAIVGTGLGVVALLVVRIRRRSTGPGVPQ